MDSQKKTLNLTVVIPLLAAIVAGFFAFVTTVWTSFETTRLEQSKFGYSLIQSALAPADRSDKADYLRFLLEIGLLSGLKEGKVLQFASDKGKSLPRSSAVRDKRISYEQAKIILNRLKDENNESFYLGRIDDEDDFLLYIALAKFQKAHKLNVDGLIGAATVLEMWNACHQCPELLRAVR